MKHMLRGMLLLSMILFHDCYVSAQGKKYRPDTSWKVFAGNNEKTLGFSGGFNNPQFGMGDLNNDGKKDLIVFEKGSLQIKTFIDYGTVGNPDYRYQPQYANYFPLHNGVTTVSSYMKIEDLNCDNIPDLVTRGNTGFSIYYGYYSGNTLRFSYYKDLYYTPLSATQEGFESNTFPTNGWKVQNSGGKGWSRVTAGNNPNVSPRQGNGMAMFNANAMSSGSTALLISRNLRVSPNLKSEGKLRFWIYRDDATAGDSVSVFINGDTTLTSATYLGGVARCRNINLPDTKPSDGWYEYTFPVPFHITGNKLYFIFKGTSRAGNNIFIDDVNWISSNPFGDVNAYVDPGGDIPGIADVDNDGDLDFFSYYIGGGYISFYKNYQKEENLPCDSIHINLKDACWGKVYQGFTLQQTLGISCISSQPIIAPAKVTHTGNTLCMFDYDGDGDVDYLNGGVSYQHIQLLKNGKADFSYVRDSIIAQDTTWQTGGHVYKAMQFPAAFHIDIDQDGKKDILISPSAELASENYHNIAYYRNTGTATSPVFTYQHDTLLVEETIDLGTGSYPVAYDYNKDGKPDLLIGSDGYFQPDGSFRARLAYYQNTTSGNSKSFTLQDNNFLNVDALNIAGAYPAVGDLDNDGLDDLVVGHTNGTISFYKNNAANSSTVPQWQLTSSILKDVNNNNIDSFQYAAPLIYDMDNDGKKDLIIGGRSGWLAYYRNVGSANQLALQYYTSKLGLVHTDPWNPLSAFSAPYLGKTDSSGNDFLVLGSNSGRIYRISGFQNGNVTSTYQVTDTIYHDLNASLGKYSGFRSVPAFADFDGDGSYEMVLGNVLGGVTIFSQQLVTEIIDTIPGAGDIIVYPNPAKDKIVVMWDTAFAQSQDIDIAIINMSGQKLAAYSVNPRQGRMDISTGNLAAGMYFCEAISGSKRSVKKVIVIR